MWSMHPKPLLALAASIGHLRSAFTPAQCRYLGKVEGGGQSKYNGLSMKGKLY